MSSFRPAFLSFLAVAVALTSGCSSTDDNTDLGGGTGAEDGKFVPPPTKPEDGQKASTPEDPAAKKDAPPAGGAANTPAPGTGTAGKAGSCGVPQCSGIAGFCGCRGEGATEQTIMVCNGGKCRCNDKTFDDNGACGGTAKADALKTLFASCGCK